MIPFSFPHAVFLLLTFNFTFLHSHRISTTGFKKKMALENVVLLSQLATYFIGFILSLCLFVPMSLHMHDFRGHCLLFSTGTWREEDGQFVVAWASQFFCDYCVFTGVFLAVLCQVQIYRLIKFLYRGSDRQVSFMPTTVEAHVDLCC